MAMKVIMVVIQDAILIMWTISACRSSC